MRRILAGALEHRGYTISEATTGMTGTEAARALKQNPQTAHIPIVGCSAHFGSEWREQALRSGMVGYVQNRFR